MTHVTALNIGVNVREARKRKGLTQEELAEMVRLDRTVINKIESGARKVAALELSDIAQALGVQMMTFFKEPVPAVVSHRFAHGSDAVDSRIDGLLANLAEEVEFVQGLTSLGLPEEREDWGSPTSDTEVEEMAHRARGILGVGPDAPMTQLSQCMSAIGLLVFSKELGPDTADAGTILLAAGGVSVINSSNKVGRRRLAAVHELAHFLVGDEYSIDWRVAENRSKTESRFDFFARAILLPKTIIIEKWQERSQRDDLRTAAVLTASEYQVDMSTLARRLEDLDVIDTSQANSIRDIRTTKTDILEFDLRPGDELKGETQPRVFQLAVLQLVRDERISSERAQELLWHSFSEEDLPQPRMRDEKVIWEYVS
jgi:Zn-dependent peptidase ImmA (M78 family)/DNA-binding XRE family transcriptional regulator